uniref:Uncharacterized protein n=1 Tax=Hippocampus comes TaxID=109280 RepID=A0A3Q2YVQ4_HIPCM
GWLPRALRCRPGWERARMTFPNAKRPVLMCTDSSKRTPVLPVLPTRSEPAKSTTQNLERRSGLSGPAGGRWRSHSVRTVCERLECSFIRVAPVWRKALPTSKTLRSSSQEETATSLAPTTTITTLVSSNQNTSSLVGQ